MKDPWFTVEDKERSTQGGNGTGDSRDDGGFLGLAGEAGSDRVHGQQIDRGHRLQVLVNIPPSTR